MQVGSKKKEIQKRKIKSSDVFSDNNFITNYVSKHWSIFKKSFNFDSVLFRLLLLDVGFILILFLSYLLVYFLWIKNTLILSNIVSILNTMQASTVPTSEIIISWHHLLLSVILMLLLILVLYILLLSIYTVLSYVIMTKKRFSLKVFLNSILIYLMFTVVYLLILLLVFYLFKNVWLAAWSVILITLLYLYTLLIFYLVIDDNGLLKVFGLGFRNMIKLYDTLPPILFALIMFLIIIAIITLIFGSIPLVVFLIVLLAIVYLSNRMKKYLHQITHV